MDGGLLQHNNYIDYQAMLSWLPQRIISVRRRPCWADIIKLIILSSTPALLSEKHMIPFSHPDYMIVLNNICVPSLSLSHSTLSPASPYARPHAALPGCGLIDGARGKLRSALGENRAKSAIYLGELRESAPSHSTPHFPAVGCIRP